MTQIPTVTVTVTPEDPSHHQQNQQNQQIQETQQNDSNEDMLSRFVVYILLF